MTGLQGNLQTIAQNLLTKFPNIKLAYYSSINYTGYSNGTTNLDPEPYGYEGGMAVKNAIQDQISGDANMNYDPAKGKVKAPWIAWGPYYWANGMIPRSDGLVWTCQDLNTDGTPSVGSRRADQDLDAAVEFPEDGRYGVEVVLVPDRPKILSIKTALLDQNGARSFCRLSVALDYSLSPALYRSPPDQTQPLVQAGFAHCR